MQTASAALVSALNNDHVLRAFPKVIFEWNQNRYAGILKVDNTPAEATSGADIDNFPIDSIVDPQRPTKGLIKGRASKSITAPSVWKTFRPTNIAGEEGYTSADYSDNPEAVRYYTTGPDSGYKYWTSPKPSTAVQRGNGSFGFPSGYGVAPYVLYKNSCKTNKIVVKFETTWARPVEYNIQTTTNGGSSWTTVASDILPDADGQVILYRQSSGAWTSTVNYGAVTTINGIRLVVTSINKSDAQFNLIELSPRLEADLSEYITEYSTNLNISETNFITPLGKASANTAEVGLSNVDGIFNNNNAASVYYQLMDKNAKVTIDLVYEIGGGTEAVREFTGYIDTLPTDSSLEISIGLKDSSKFLQEEKVPSILLENVTVGEAVWRLCDAVGFKDFIYTRVEESSAAALPYFWTEDENTVWDTLQELAEATQTAIYFDEFDKLRIKTRESAYDLTQPVAWSLEATNNNGKLADVESAEITADYEANVVNISYKDTKTTDDTNGLPAMHIVWEPQDDFVLRSSRLTRALGTTDTSIRIDPAEVATWPFEGMMNVDGEMIRYEGKQYTFHRGVGSTSTRWVYSNDEKINIDKNLTDPDLAYKSVWTGNLKIKERGALWSSPRPHTVDIAMWSGRTVARNLLVTGSWNGGIYHNINESVMRVTSPTAFDPDSLYTVTRMQPADQNYRRYGTRIRIPSTNKEQGGCGIVINSGDYDSGYYIELIRTETIEANGGALRNYIHEVGFFARHVNGSHHRLAGKGTRMAIASDTWYDLDVDFYETAGGQHQIVAYVNGIVALRVALDAGRVAKSGRFGVYQRGRGTADYQYFFAHAGGDSPRDDEVGLFDRTRGGFISGQWEHEYVYGTRDATRRVGNTTQEYKQKYAQYFFDEFGPICQEVREMDVVFEKYPVLHSRPYTTNYSKVVIPEYNSNPFGAKFLLANSSRDNAILNGEDTLSGGPDTTIQQKMFIYGRLIFQEDEQVYTAKNDRGDLVNPLENLDAIRRRGRVEVDINSKWVQSKGEAQAIGDWILKHWAGGNDEVAVNVFGNPLFQLGDIVSLDYPDKNIFKATHKYFVVDIKNSYSQGLSTSLLLRRAKV